MGVAILTRAQLRPPAEVRPIFLFRSALYGVCTGLYLAGTPVFFIRYVGLTAHQVSVGISVGFALSAILRVPSGILTDALGSVPSWMIATAAAAALFCAYPFVHGVTAFVIVTAAVSACEGLILSAATKYFGEVFPDGKRARGNAYLRSVANGGMAIGTAIAGLLVAFGTRGSYVAIIWVYVGVMICDFVLIATALRGANPTGHARRTRHVREHAAWRDRRFGAVTVLCSVFSLNGPLLSVLLPLWVLTQTDAPAVTISVVMLTNMLLVILLQVRAARDAETLSGGARTLRKAGIALAMCCAALAPAAHSSGALTIALLLIAALAVTAGEVLSSAASWGISYKLAPVAQRGEYLALFSMGGQLAWAVGPLLLTTLALAAYPIGWIVIAAVFLVASLASEPVIRYAGGKPVSPPVQSALPRGGGQ